MTQIRIHNPVQSDFAMVPNVLWTWPGLSFKARSFMAYLLSFRHGVCPPVAAMEQETGIGRDARRAVMVELERAGLARWVIQRDSSGRVVAKFLEVSTLPLLAAVVTQAQAQDVSRHAPEKPSHGVHAPEKPSDGFSGPRPLKIRAGGPENPAILKREEKDKGRAPVPARPAPPRRGGLAGSSPAVLPGDLSPVQCREAWAGRSFVVGSGASARMIRAGSPELETLRLALRTELAERGAQHGPAR